MKTTPGKTYGQIFDSAARSEMNVPEGDLPMSNLEGRYLQQAEVTALKEAQVDIARLEERVENLTRLVYELRDSLVGVTAKLNAIQTTMSEARGGWRTLVLFGGALTTLGALLGWLAERITWRGLP